MSGCKIIPVIIFSKCAEEMSWEKGRQNSLREKLWATAGRRGLRKRGPGTETGINRGHYLPHSKTFLLHFPPLVQISHTYCLSGVLESFFHVPFLIYNDSPVNPRNKLSLHKLPGASAWVCLYSPALTSLTTEDCALHLACSSDHEIQSSENGFGQQTLCLI